MFCRYCGSKLDDDAAFCGKCGKPVADHGDVKDAGIKDDKTDTPDNEAFRKAEETSGPGEPLAYGANENRSDETADADRSAQKGRSGGISKNILIIIVIAAAALSGLISFGTVRNGGADGSAEDLLSAESDQEQEVAEDTEDISAEEEDAASEETQTETVDGLEIYADVIEFYCEGISTQWSEYEDDRTFETAPYELGYSWYYDWGITSLDEAGYTFMDLDDNGIPELLISQVGEDGSVTLKEVYTYADQNVVHLISAEYRGPIYLCEGNFIEAVLNGGWATNLYLFYELETGEQQLSIIEAVYEDVLSYTNSSEYELIWSYGYDYATDSDTDSYTEISEEEAQSILDSYAAISYDVVLLSDYADENGLVYEVASDDEDYLIADSDVRLLTDEDIEGMTAKELNYAKNEIYARHGRMFNAQELQEYFESKDWYEALYTPDEFDENVTLSSIEITNATFLSEACEEAGGYTPE